MRIEIFKSSVFICLLSFLALVIRSQTKDTNLIAYWDFDHAQDKNVVDSGGGKQDVINGYHWSVQGLKGQSPGAAALSKDTGLTLMGNRFLTLITLLRVNQIEISRNEAVGEDASSIHSPEEASAFRETVEKAFPGVSEN